MSPHRWSSSSPSSRTWTTRTTSDPNPWSSLLAALSPREQFVLKLRFGLDGQPHHSLSQIGTILAVSKERVRQIQDRALRKLRDAHGSPAASAINDQATVPPEMAGLGRSRPHE